jgi:hypothetical protein
VPYGSSRLRHSQRGDGSNCGEPPVLQNYWTRSSATFFSDESSVVILRIATAWA